MELSIAENINESLDYWQQALEKTACYKWLTTGKEERFWEQFAENYYRNRTSGHHYLEVLGHILKAIPKRSDLLEIGPGPGVFTLPLAKHVGSFTAVEPSPAVVKVLQKKTAHLNNFRIINDYWENVSVEPHDVVLAAGVLYAFYDIEAALKKMIRHARQKVVLVSLEDEQPLLKEMALALHLPPPVPSGPPTALLLDVLENLTSSFSYEKLSGEQIYQYSNRTVLLDLWKRSLKLTPSHLPQIESFIEGKGISFHNDCEITISRLFSTYVIEVYT